MRDAAALALLAVLALAGCGEGKDPATATVRIGTKNFTEQFLLGEMMKLVVEAKTDLRVDLRANLGGTMICHGALAAGEIDLYAEYTGTGLTAVLGREAVTESEDALRAVQEGYRERFGCEWLEPFGFDNTYTLTVRRDRAGERGWKTIGDLAANAEDLHAGFTAEFVERPDGYPKLKEVYGLAFGAVSDLDPGLLYEAVARGEVDVICGFATDGRIGALDLVPLEDDRHLFPPYHAAPVVRGEVLRRHPALGEALALLAGKIDDETMGRLNLEVDRDGRDPADVAREFLREIDILD